MHTQSALSHLLMIHAHLLRSRPHDKVASDPCRRPHHTICKPNMNTPAVNTLSPANHPPAARPYHHSPALAACCLLGVQAAGKGRHRQAASRQTSGQCTADPRPTTKYQPLKWEHTHDTQHFNSRHTCLKSAVWLGQHTVILTELATSNLSLVT